MLAWQQSTKQSLTPDPFQKQPGSFQARGPVAGPALLCLKEVSSLLIVFQLTAACTRTPRGIVEPGARRILLAHQMLSSVRWMVAFAPKASQLSKVLMEDSVRANCILSWSPGKDV